MCPGTKPVPARDFFLFYSFEELQRRLYQKNTELLSFLHGKAAESPLALLQGAAVPVLHFSA